MRVILVVGIIVTVGFILLGVLWNASVNTSKRTENVQVQPETAVLKKQMDKLSESLKEQGVRYQESQKELVRLSTQISQLLGNEAAVKTDSEVVSKTQTQEVSKLNTTLIILRDEVSKRKAEINRLQKEKEGLAILGGVYESKFVGVDMIKHLASIPSRDTLLTQLAFVLHQPVAGLARVLMEVRKNKQ